MIPEEARKYTIKSIGKVITLENEEAMVEGGDMNRGVAVHGGERDR